jgi:hypothetical protein
MQAASSPASPSNGAAAYQRHPRMLLSVAVMLRHSVPGGVRFTHGISLDISESGLGALMRAGLRVGETVTLELELPEYDLKTLAAVRHSSAARSGFEFLGLTREERRHIAQLVGSA